MISNSRGGFNPNITVKEAWLNTLIAVEVYFWFIAGECLGKRGVIGYDIEGATDWNIHF